MIGLGTDVLLRALVGGELWPDDHPGRIHAARALVHESLDVFFVNHVVLAEVVWVLTQHLQQPKSTVVAILDGLLASANVVIDGRDAVTAALADFRSGKAGFADHLIGHVNRMAGCSTTATFDKDAGRGPTFRHLKVGGA